MTPTRSLPDVIYVAGYARSGSTILGMALGAHPATFVAGELGRIFERWIEGDQICSCAQVLDECAFWSAVMSRFRLELPDIPFEEANKITNEVDRFRMTPWKWQRSRQKTVDEYRRVWRTMLQSIAAVSGAVLIVDTSKTAHPRAHRPVALATLAGVRVKVVFLVRDPRAVMWSQHAASFRKRVRKRYTFEPTLLSWIGTNLYAIWLQRSVHLESTILTYEGFTESPNTELQRIGSDLGLDLTAVIASISGQQPILASHVFDGNAIRSVVQPLHRQTPTWREQMPRYARYLALLSFPIARRYGYRVTDWRGKGSQDPG